MRVILGTVDNAVLCVYDVPVRGQVFIIKIALWHTHARMI